MRNFVRLHILGTAKTKPSSDFKPSQLIASLMFLALLATPVFSYSCDALVGTVLGTVSTIGPDGQSYNAPGAKVRLISTSQSISLFVLADDSGEYKFGGVMPGSYKLEVALDGFEDTTRLITIHAGETATENVKLEVKTVREEVTINTSREGLNPTDTEPASELRQTNLQTIPLANERFQDALPLIPGVVRGPDGLLNVKGSRASQSGLTVNSTNVTDPVTGEFAINLPVEAIQSVQVLTNPYAAEYGKFSGAVTAIETRPGTNKFNVQAQSFFPRLRRRGGSFVGTEAFTPRVTFSGPLKKDKIQFIESFEYRYVRTPVESLPPLHRDTGLESFDSVSQLDWEVNSTNHLTTTFSLFPQKLSFVGLNTFNPQTVTPNFKQRGFFWAVNERAVLNSHSVLESTFSIKQFDANIFPSSGNAPMVLAPDVNSGNFFNRQDRRSRRYEGLEVFNFNQPELWGSHFIKAGAGVSYSKFDGSNTSNSVWIVRADGTRSQQIDFVGPGMLSRNKAEYLSFLQDKWSINNRLTIEFGVRYDRDDMANENNVAPRIAFALMPIADGRTVIRGGVGLFYDKIDLNVATFTQMQERVITEFSLDGQQIIGSPMPQHFTLDNGRLLTPRSVNWNLEFDREWMKNLFVRVGYQERYGDREFIVDPVNNQLLLSNRGRSDYHEFQITTRYRLGENDELVASYIHSSARGDLNDFNSFFANFEQPVIQPNERSPLPWDAPNRFLFWGNVSAKYGLTIAPVLDVRSGFPLSIVDADRTFIGPRNQTAHFPRFFSVDMQVLKSVRVPGKWNSYRVRLGFKVFNLTNHFNPRDFQGNLASTNFGTFSNGVGRKFGMRFVIEKK
jgi:hypothetical protein